MDDFRAQPYSTGNAFVSVVKIRSSGEILREIRKVVSGARKLLNFRPLLKVALEWAIRDDQPEGLVLRRVCHWAMAAGFPSGSFIGASGQPIRPFDIYMSFRNTTETTGFDGTLLVDGEAVHVAPGHWPESTLRDSYLSVEGLKAFCLSTDTAVPASLDDRSFLSRLFASRRRYGSPPECPDAEKFAGRFFARENAAGLIQTLDELTRSPRQVWNNRRRPDEPFDLEAVNSHWKSNFESALYSANRSGDPDLTNRLEVLRGEWIEFMKGYGIVANADQPAQRGRGRPAGSGSYDELDQPLVLEIRNLLKSGVSLTAACLQVAPKASGGGTIESKARRLSNRYQKAYGE